MIETNGIPTESKIIIGVEYSEKTGWYSLHLHDALYAVSIRPEQERVVIAEGRGRGRLRHLRIPFKNIFRFEVVEIPIGHSCLEYPVDAGPLGERQLIPEDKPFTPVMVRLLIKHSTRNDFISIHDLGATPLPILVPLLRSLPEDRFANANIALTSADDCFTLSRSVIEWVRNVNASLELVRNVGVEGVATHGEQVIPQPAEVSDYEQIQRICSNLESYDKLEVQQTLVSALAEIQVSIYLYIYSNIKNRRMVKMAGAARVCRHFPLNIVSHDTTAQDSYLTVDNLYEASRMYYERTHRPIQEAFNAIAEHVHDLEQRYATMESNKDISISEENAPRPLNIIDPKPKINKKNRVLSGVGLRHEDQLLRVFKNEEIEVYYLEKLPFLSLLVEYQTEDGQRHYAAVIRAGLHQALREFLLAHEMGHWFLHVGAAFAARYEQVDRFLRSTAQRELLEKEADNFGMSVLFPHAYLADRMIFQEGISANGLLNEFVVGMEPVSDRLRTAMRRYIGEHIEKYKKVKKTEEPGFLTLEVESIEESDLEGLLILIHKAKDTVYWVRLSQDSIIMDASENSEELFGLTRDQIIGLTPAHLVMPEEIEPMRLRAEYRKKNKKAIYYFTEVLNKKKSISRQVIVYSFPILNKGEYVGAMAALRLLDEIETESLPS
jgi:PAS domain S-box-containing protein